MNNIRDTTIGKRIAMIREHRGMSQAALAAAIEVSKSVIFHYEHGQTRITVDHLEKLAIALHCAARDLLAALDTPIPRIRLRGPAPTAVGFHAAERYA
jgi:transcriptional regulator with XRE-family HTH domain